MPKTSCHPAMTVREFDNGYWYATELREFAKEIGIPTANRLRKDELERAIRAFLQSGNIDVPAKRGAASSSERDSERGLSLSLPITDYRNDKATWDFVEREALKISGAKGKSGAKYRLNRWREQQIDKGRRITYGDLVREYARLNRSTKPFEQIPHGRYINFISDFFAGETNVTHKEARRAWAEVKKIDAPKTYRSWVRFSKTRRGR